MSALISLELMLNLLNGDIDKNPRGSLLAAKVTAREEQSIGLLGSMMESNLLKEISKYWSNGMFIMAQGIAPGTKM